MGKVKFDIGYKVSFVTPYQYMNEKCPTEAPDYDRKDKC